MGLPLCGHVLSRRQMGREGCLDYVGPFCGSVPLGN